MINIFRAKVTPAEEGYLLLEITGKKKDIAQGMDYVKGFGVTINESQKGLLWDQQKCTSCTNCIPRCPTKALHIPDRRTMKVAFDPDKCIECLNCVKNCVYNACYSLF